MADAMVFFSCSFLAKILPVSERASASYLGVNCPCGVGAHFISSTTTWICTCTIVGTWDI